MTRLFASALLVGAIGLSNVGCEASGRIGDDDVDTAGEYKKTTTVERSEDGTTETKKVTVDREVD